tara:strand:+ start:227 stop:595 length:369 start_codon:yes stop_codon:yes gene_type:complete
MGFDIVGKKAKSEKGEYFRNNVWFWRPLWQYICIECDDILTIKQAEGGCFNDGVKISKAKAERIAKRLEEKIQDGSVDLHKAGYDATVDKVGDKWAQNYPFLTENVVKFAEFCKESGGFEIW